MIVPWRSSWASEPRCFLGAFQWFSSFTEGVAWLSVPLNQLRSDTVSWMWGREQQQAFEGLRTAPRLEQTIHHGNGCPHDCVWCGAPAGGSPGGVRGKSAETQLGITALELSAVVFALERWHVYLHGPRQFRLLTEHKSLQWIKETRNLSSKLAQWALVIQGYNIKFLHRPGRIKGS